MDTPVKALVNIFLTFAGLLLLVSCLTLFMAYDNATDALYGVIQDVEIYGNDPQRISQYAQASNTVIDVQPVATSGGQRFQVTVFFNHMLGFISRQQHLQVQAMTRIVEY
jgi:hypothetical protein